MHVSAVFTHERQTVWLDLNKEIEVIFVELDPRKAVFMCQLHSLKRIRSGHIGSH
jgi:hypothetical protein